METVTLWTRQVPQVWEELRTIGIYRCKAEYIAAKNGSMTNYYLDLYRWYTQEASKHIALEEGQDFPIWLCLDEDLMLQPVPNTVILKIEAPRDKVLLCNNDAWGYRVNYWYVPVDEADEERHRQELARNGIHSDDELISTTKGNFYPLLRKKIRDSWSRVFTQMDVKRDMLTSTMWELRKEWVKEVRIYEAEDVDGADA